jgi:hypothetical protein
LSIQYVAGAETLAVRLGISDIEAHHMLRQHRELFAQYWQWSDDWLQAALQTGVMRTAFGWTCRTGIIEFNERSIRNWPIQATGADILRIACIFIVRHGIKLLAPIHDAVLIEASLENIEKDVAFARECMRRASRIVLNNDPTATHELRTDYKIIRWPDPGARTARAASWSAGGNREDCLMGVWEKQKLAELEAAAPCRRKRKKVEAFVHVPLWWITQATKLTRTPAALVCIELLYRSWKAKSLTFPFSNKTLQKLGVSREIKRKSGAGMSWSG